MKVLIVEDTPEQAYYLQEQLRNMDIEYLVAKNGKIALDFAFNQVRDDHKIGLILLDIGLPDINGIKVCHELKSNPETKDIPIIFLTAYHEEEYLHQAFEAGASDYLTKPYSDLNFRPRIKLHLQNYRFLCDINEANAQLNSNFEEMLQISESLRAEIEIRRKYEAEIEEYKNNLEKNVEERTKELELNRLELQTIFDNTPAIMLLLNADGKLLNINKSGLNLTGKTIDESKHKRIGEVLLCPQSNDDYKGCSFSIECTNCILNKLFLDTIQNKTPLNKVETVLKVSKNNSILEYIVNISTSIVSESEQIILMTLDDITEQKHAQIQLLENEEKYRELFQTKNEAVILLDAETKKFLDVNNAALKLYGYSKEEILNLKPEDISAQPLETNKMLNNLVSTGIDQKAEYRRHKRKDGSIIIVETNVKLFNHRNKKIIYTTIFDITEKHHALSALKESEEKFRHITESITDYIYTTHIKNGKPEFTEHSAVCETITGYKAEEFKAKSYLWYDIIHPQDRSLVVTSLEASIKTKNKSTFEHRIIHKINTIKWIRNTQIPFFDSDGNLFKFEGIISDITEKKEAEIALRKSEFSFRMLVESIDDIFWIFDLTVQKLIYISPQRERLTGRKPEDVMADFTSIINLAHPADQMKMKEAFGDIIRGENVSIEYRTMTENNDIKWISFKSFKQTEAFDDHVLVFGLASDITHQKLAERKILNAILETENREREVLSKELHDGLGANLSSIKMYLDRLNDKDLQASKKDFYLSNVLDLIQQAAHTTREISHNLKPHTLVNLGLVYSIESLVNKINGLGILKMTFHNYCEELIIDDESEMAIYRILTELCNNSLKYSHAKNASILLSVNQEKLNLEYSDDGEGFDIEIAMSNQGSGLKNIIARVNALGGNFSIHSKIGEGMKIQIQITINNSLDLSNYRKN